MKLTLFLLLGYPGSGKSTFSKQLAEARGMVRVNSDELRRYMFKNVEAIRNPANNPAVFGALDYATEQLLAIGRSVIYDANYNRRSDRKDSEKLAAKHSADTVILWVKTPVETARKREAERVLEDADILRIPPERYEQLINALQEPRPTEKVIVVYGLAPFEEQLRSFDEQLAALEV